MSQFILSVESGSAIQAVAEEVKRLIPDSEVRALENVSIILLSCSLREAEEVTEKLVSCKAVERVISDFPIKPPEWFVSPYPDGPYQKVV